MLKIVFHASGLRLLDRRKLIQQIAEQRNQSVARYVRNRAIKRLTGDSNHLRFLRHKYRKNKIVTLFNWSEQT